MLGAYGAPLIVLLMFAPLIAWAAVLHIRCRKEILKHRKRR
jgi:hypothetical protein